jgi:hypothetical protein
VAPTAKFEEKTFETAYCIEIATGPGGHPVLFSPGQVLEKILGFDAAANPGPRHILWKVLRLPRPPGLNLLPGLWAGGIQPTKAKLPTYPVSVFLQFKRPDYLRGARAKQWKLWKSPYYRFERTTHQHTVLARLERNLTTQAVVRYAAPAFHTLPQLEAAQLTRSVIASSGHVAPLRLGRHRVWTYQRPGSYGRPNPSGDPVPFELFGDLLEQAVVRRNEQQQLEVYQDDELAGLTRHLEVVASACRAREPRLRSAVDAWARLLPRAGAEPDDVQRLSNFASIQSLMAREHMTWWLA